MATSEPPAAEPAPFRDRVALAVLANPYVTSQVISVDGGTYPH